MSTHKSIIKSATVIGIATFCSRILGFVRDIVIARLFGVYVYAQAFVVAFKIPNLFRDLLGEGAANAVFVPVFSEYTVKHTKEEFWELANVVFNLLLVILMAVTILGIVFAPFIVRIIAPGFIADPYKLETTVRLCRILFPYILLVSLAAYAMGILNSLKHFTVPAFAPCLLNISVIICAIVYGEGIKGLASGVLIGGILQLGVQIPVLYKKGFRLKGALRRFRHPAAKMIFKLMIPRLFSSSIYQLNNLVDSIFGSLSAIVGEGGVAGLYFSYRLIQFPLGIFSNALSQVILPAFSIQVLDDNREKMKQTLSFGLRAVFFVMLPASAGFMVLSKSIISTLFQGGKFDAYSTLITSKTLVFYSIGLFAYGAIKILQSCFFALKDTLTPAKVSFLALIINILLNSLLIFPFGLAGLSLATSLSGINTFFILFFILKKKISPFDIKPVLSSFIRILIASICMGGICYLVSSYGVLSGANTFNKILNLMIAVISGLFSYVIFCFIFKVSEMRELWRWLVKKKNTY